MAWFGSSGGCISTLGGVTVIGDCIHASTDLAPLDRDLIPAVVHTDEDRIAENVLFTARKMGKVIKRYNCSRLYTDIYSSKPNRLWTFCLNVALFSLNVQIVRSHCCCGIVLDYSSPPSDQIVRFYICCNGCCLGIFARCVPRGTHVHYDLVKSEDLLNSVASLVAHSVSDEECAQSERQKERELHWLTKVSFLNG